MMATVGLINMNGRVYDPVLARFISADPNIDSPSNSLSYNRYSYVANNPVNATDPSGFHKSNGILSSVIGIVVTIVATVVTYGIATSFAGGFWATFEAAITSASGGLAGAGATLADLGESAAWGLAAVGIGGFAGGFASGFSGTLLNGGTIGEAFRSGLIGGGWGALSALTAAGIGAEFDQLHLGEGFGGGGWFGRAIAHGVADGAIAAGQGGNFRSGFFSGAFTAGAEPALDQIHGDGIAIAERTVVAATIGGTASVIGGGKFANGAISGAFQHLFNEEAQHASLFERWNEKAQDSLKDYLYDKLVKEHLPEVLQKSIEKYYSGDPMKLLAAVGNKEAPLFKLVPMDLKVIFLYIGDEYAGPVAEMNYKGTISATVSLDKISGDFYLNVTATLTGTISAAMMPGEPAQTPWEKFWHDATQIETGNITSKFDFNMGRLPPIWGHTK